MMGNNDDIKWLYGKFQKAGVDTGSLDEFTESLQNGEDRSWYYKKAKSLGLDVGDAADFYSLVTGDDIYGDLSAPEDTVENTAAELPSVQATAEPTKPVTANDVQSPIAKADGKAQPDLSSIKYPIAPNKSGLDTSMQFKPAEAPSQYVSPVEENAQRAAVQASGDVLSPEEAEAMKAELAAGQRGVQKAMAPLQTPILEETGHESDFNAIAESVWNAAEERTKAAQEESAEKIGELYSGIAAGPQSGTGYAQAIETLAGSRAAHLSNHDLEQMSADAWDSLGREQQEAIINDIYAQLREKYPYHNNEQLLDVARATARSRSDQALYDLAIKKNAPADTADFFLRKVAGANMLSKITDAMARKQAGTSGDMLARNMAEQQYGQEHKLADIAGTVIGMGLDPLTWISGGLGSAAAKAGGAILGRAAAETLGGRMLLGSLASSANLGTYMSGNEALEQLRLGGKVEEDGKIGDYDFGEIGKSALRGAGLGLATGAIAPLIGNVSDKLVRATRSTAGKAALRAAELGAGTVAEATVFSLPEWISGEGDAFDVWTDNLAMMAGFKLQHAMKSAPKRIAELARNPESKAGFETRLRKMLDGNPGLALTKDEKAELDKGGYTDLRELTEAYKRGIDAKEQDGEYIGYNRFMELMNNNNISEAARAKMYYYVTGKMLPMSTVMGSDVIDNGNGTYTVRSIGANGVITSREFNSERRAQTELQNINRQAELNAIDIGEQFAGKKVDGIREDIINEYFVNPELVIKKEPIRRSEAEQKALEAYVDRLYEGVERPNPEQPVRSTESEPSAPSPEPEPEVQVEPEQLAAPATPVEQAPAQPEAPSPEPQAPTAPIEDAKENFVQRFKGDVTQKGAKIVVPVFKGNQLVGYLYGRVPSGNTVFEKGADGVNHGREEMNYLLNDIDIQNGNLKPITISEEEFNKRDESGNPIYRIGSMIPEDKFYSDYVGDLIRGEEAANADMEGMGNDAANINGEAEKQQISEAEQQILENATPEQRSEIIKNQSRDDFMSKLPNKNGKLDYNKFTPTQTFRFTAETLGLDLAVARAEKFIADTEAEIAKVDRLSAPLEKLLEMKDKQAQIDEYKNILAEYNTEVPKAAPVAAPVPEPQVAPVAEQPVQTPAPAPAPAPRATRRAAKKDIPEKTESTVAALTKKDGARTARRNAAAKAAEGGIVDNADAILADFQSGDKDRVNAGKKKINAYASVLDADAAREELAKAQEAVKASAYATPERIMNKYLAKAIERRLKDIESVPADEPKVEAATQEVSAPETPAAAPARRTAKPKKEPAATPAPVSETVSKETPAPAPVSVAKKELSDEAMAVDADKFINNVLKAVENGGSTRSATKSRLATARYANDEIRKTIIDQCVVKAKELSDTYRKTGGSGLPEVLSRLNTIKDEVEKTMQRSVSLGHSNARVDAAEAEIKEAANFANGVVAKYADRKLASDDEYADVSYAYYYLKGVLDEYDKDTTLPPSVKNTFQDIVRDVYGKLSNLMKSYTDATHKKHSEIINKYGDLKELAKKNKANGRVVEIPEKKERVSKREQEKIDKKADAIIKKREAREKVNEEWDKISEEARYLNSQINAGDGFKNRIAVLETRLAEMEEAKDDFIARASQEKYDLVKSNMEKGIENLRAQMDDVQKRLDGIDLEKAWRNFRAKGGSATKDRIALAEKLGVKTGLQKEIPGMGEAVPEEQTMKAIEFLSPALENYGHPINAVRKAAFNKAFAEKGGQEATFGDVMDKLGIEHPADEGNEVAGFVAPDGEIYINLDAARASTPFHEICYHALMRFAEENGESEAVQAMLEYGEHAPEWAKQHVREKYGYEEGSDAFKKEAGAFAFGEYGAGKMKDMGNRNLFEKMMDAIRKLLRKLADRLGIKRPMNDLSTLGAMRGHGFDAIGNAIWKMFKNQRPIKGKPITADGSIEKEIIGEKYAKANGMIEDLEVAKAMREAGKDAQTISDATGWYYSEKGGGWMKRVPTLKFRQSGGISRKYITPEGYQQLRDKIQNRINEIVNDDKAQGRYNTFMTGERIISDPVIGPLMRNRGIVEAKALNDFKLKMPDTYEELEDAIVNKGFGAAFGLGRTQFDDYLDKIEKAFPEVISREDVGEGGFYKSLFEEKTETKDELVNRYYDEKPTQEQVEDALEYFIDKYVMEPDKVDGKLGKLSFLAERKGLDKNSSKDDIANAIRKNMRDDADREIRNWSKLKFAITDWLGNDFVGVSLIDIWDDINEYIFFEHNIENKIEEVPVTVTKMVPNKQMLGKVFSIDDVFEPSEQLERLKKAYPLINDLKIKFERGLFNFLDSTRGTYNDKTNTLTINPYSSLWSKEPNTTEEEALETGTHEIQHLVQREENFGRGGNKKMKEVEEDSHVVAAQTALEQVLNEMNNKVDEILENNPEYVTLSDEQVIIVDKMDDIENALNKYEDILKSGKELSASDMKKRDALAIERDKLQDRFTTIRYELASIKEDTRKSDELKEYVEKINNRKAVVDAEKFKAYQRLFGETQSRASSRGVTADENKTALDLMKEQAVSDEIGTEDQDLEDMPFIYKFTNDDSASESRQLTPEQEEEVRALNHQYGDLEGLLGLFGDQKYSVPEWLEFFTGIKYKDPVLLNMLSRKSPVSLMSADDIREWANKRYRSFNPANIDISGSHKPKYFKGKPVEMKWRGKTYNISDLGDGLDYFLTVMVDNIHSYNSVRDKIKKAGGKIPEDGLDILYTNRMERGKTMRDKMKDKYLKPVNDATVAIIKHLKNGSEKKAAELFKEIGYYLMAIHAPERNKWITIDKAMEEVEGRPDTPTEPDVVAMYDGICLGNQTAKDYAGASAATQKVAKYLEEKKDPTKRNESGKNEEISLDDSGAAAIVADMERRVPEPMLNNLRQAVRNMSQAELEISKAYGLIDQEFIDRCNRRYPNYVPFRDWEKDKDRVDFWENFEKVGGRGEDAFKSLRQKAEPDVRKVAYGRETVSENPIPMLWYNMSNSIFMGEENKARQKLYELADMNRGLSNLIYSDYIDKDGDVVPAGPMPKWLHDIPEDRRGKYSVTTYINGKRIPVYINGNDGQLLHRGMEDPISAIRRWRQNSQGFNEVYGDNMMLMSALSQLRTTYNPYFPVKNMIRDFGRAIGQEFITRPPKEFVRFIARIVPSFIECANAAAGKKSQMYEEFEEDGGFIGYSHLGSPQRYADDARRTIERITMTGSDESKLEKASEDWRNIAEMFENAARYDAYVTARENGVSRAEAAHIAHEISTNLSRRGTQQGFSAHTMFFNANLQSAAQGVRNAKEHPVKTGIWLGVQAALGFLKYYLGSLIAAYLKKNAQEKENEKRLAKGKLERPVIEPGVFDRDNPYGWIPDDVKRNAFLIPTGVNEYDEVKGVPLPNAFGYRYNQYLGELLLDLRAGRITPAEYRKKAWQAALSEYNPLSGSALSEDKTRGQKGLRKLLNLVPSTIRPIFEAFANVDNFGNELFAEPKEGTAAASRSKRQNAKYGTNPIVRELTPGFMHPEQVEHLLKSYGGWFYEAPAFYISDMLMPKSEQAKYGPRHSPGRRAFFRDYGGYLTGRLEEMKKYGNLERSYIKRTEDALGEGKKGLDSQYWKDLKNGYVTGASAMLDEYERKKEDLNKQYNQALEAAKNKGIPYRRRKALDEAAMRVWDEELRKLDYKTWRLWEAERNKIIGRIGEAINEDK